MKNDPLYDDWGLIIRDELRLKSEMRRADYMNRQMMLKGHGTQAYYARRIRMIREVLKEMASHE